MGKPSDDPIAKELEDIKKLMILQLIDKGYSQGDLASVLGVSQSSVSRMFPAGVPKAKGA